MVLQKQEQKTEQKPTQTKLALQSAKLNQAAADLLEQLPDHAGQLVHSLCKQYQMPLWQYTAGILLAVHLEGRLSEFRLDPAWKDGLKTSELICKHCGKSFKPRHIGQPYCSNECGMAAVGPPELKLKETKQDAVVIPNNPAMPIASATSAWDSAVEISEEA